MNLDQGGIKKICIAIAVLFVLCSCGSDAGDATSAEPIGMDTLHCLIPVDSIGVQLGDSCYVFGDVWDLCVLPDGSIAVLDGTVKTVRFYTSDGEYVRSFSPIGSGPGEFMGMEHMGCNEHGDLMLSSFYDRKLAWFDSNLSLIDEIIFTSANRSGAMRVYPAQDTGFVAVTSIMPSPDSAGMEVALYRGSDEPLIVYGRRLAPYDPYGNFQSATQMICTTDLTGRIYLADDFERQFSIVCLSADGDSLFRIDRPYEPVRRPQEELDALLEQARQNWIRGTGSSEGFSWQPPEYYPSLASMMVDGDGRLWVRDGAVDTLFHVFSGSGQYLFDCPLVMPGWQESGGWSVRINSNGIVASPRDPESYPLLYMLEEVVEVIPASDSH